MTEPRVRYEIWPLAQGADFVDLDGPLLLARARCPGLRYAGSLPHPPARELWG